MRPRHYYVTSHRLKHPMKHLQKNVDIERRFAIWYLCLSKVESRYKDLTFSICFSIFLSPNTMLLVLVLFSDNLLVWTPISNSFWGPDSAIKLSSAGNRTILESESASLIPRECYKTICQKWFKVSSLNVGEVKGDVGTYVGRVFSRLMYDT